MDGRTKLIADVAVFADGKCALARYRDTEKYDGEPGWFLPDDYLRRFEHPEEAARRIVREQLGLEPAEMRLSHIESFEGNGFWHLTFHFWSRLPAAETIAAGPAVAAAGWFPLDSLPPEGEVAHGGWAIETLREIRSREPALAGA